MNVLVLLLLAIITGFFVAHPAHAAVPVAVVQFDAGTDFETSILSFLGDLFDKLTTKQLESSAAFELLKVEKAREDVNKLMQEVQEELTDYGIALAVQDYRVSKDPRCLEEPSTCPTANELSISPYKQSRIINNVYDYIFEEPREKARVYTMCYFNLFIWDQAGILDDMFGDAGLMGAPQDPPDGLCAIGGKDVTPGGPTKCTYGSKSTRQSINKLRETRDAMLFGLRRANYYQLDYPQIFLFGDWMGYPETSNAAIQQYGLAGRGEFDSAEMRKMSLANCIPILADTSTPLLPDPALRFHNVSLEQVMAVLPSLIEGTAGRPQSTLIELRAVQEDKNNIDGVARIAISNISRIINETQKERELTYLAGQGIRPERLYLELNNKDEAGEPIDPIRGGPGDLIQYEYDTGYIVAPAVVLLQKMQAANQAMFDLAQKSFLYLDPERTSLSTLNRYNVVSNADTCYDDDGNTFPCAFIGGFFERQICNVVPNNPSGTYCFPVDPWLKPRTAFRSAPDAKRVGPNFKTSQDSPLPILSSEGGLPAPWEDESAYVALGNEKVGAAAERGSQQFDLKYKISDYKFDTPKVAYPGILESAGWNKGDNIGLKALGADYAINDWYDRVFEMYEPYRNENTLTFGPGEWTCYIATWFRFRQVEGNLVPTFASTRTVIDIGERTFSILPTAKIIQGPTVADALQNQIDDYCGERLSDTSY